MNRLLSCLVARSTVIASLAVASIALIAASAQATITIDSNLVIAYAGDVFGSGAYNNFRGTTIPTSTTLDAIDGNAYSKNVVDWSLSGGQTTLKFDIDHNRLGAYASYTYTQFWLTFAANVTEPYTLSGYYNVTDVGSSNGAVEMRVAFSDDETSNVDLFRQGLASISTYNEQFVLGELGGDYYEQLSGSLTGTLIAGHQYSLSIGYDVIAGFAADSGASALGNFTLTIGVPEPSTLLLLGIGAISLLGYRKAK